MAEPATMPKEVHSIENEKGERRATTGEPQNSEASDQYVTGFLLALNVSALLMSIFLVALDLTIVSTAIPRITHDFQSLDQVGWYGSAFFLTMAVFQSLWGKVYKYFPLKESFLLSIFIFELGTLICAVSQNSATLIAGRAIEGVGGGGVISGTYIVLARIVRPDKVPVYIGLTGVVFTLASVAGPLIGGAFTNDVTWRWCFYINLPIGGLTVAILVFSLHLHANTKPVEATWREILLQMDIPGSIAIIGALICYLLALQWGGITKSWGSSPIVGLLVGWICLSIVFGLVEYLQGERALIAPRFLRNRAILVCCVYIFFLNAANYLRIYYIPIYFQAIDNVSPAESGIRNLPLIVATSLFTLVAGALIGKIGYYQPFLIVGGVLITVGSGLIYTLDVGSSAGKYIGYQILVGIGDGLAVQIPVTACQAFSDPIDIPTITATVLFFQQLSGALGVSAGESLFTNRLLINVPRNAPNVTSSQILSVGASELRQNFSAAELAGIVRAYVVGLRAAWAATIVFCGLALVTSLFATQESIIPSSKVDVVDEAKNEEDQS